MRLDALDQWLRAPPRKEAELTRLRIAASTLMMIVVLATVLAAMMLVSGRLATGLLNGAVGLGAGGLLFFLRRGVALEPISTGLAVTLVAATILSALVGDGVGSMMTPWVVIAPLFALVQLGRRAAWITAATMWAATAVIYALEVSETFLAPGAPMPRMHELDRLLSYALATVAVLWLAQAAEGALTLANERRRANELTDQMRQRQHELWKLAAGLAHEVNNPLTALLMNAQYVEAVVGACGRCQPDVLTALKDATSSSSRVASLISDLRLITTLDETSNEIVDVLDVAKTLTHSSPGISVEGTSSRLRVNRTAFDRVLRELVRNSRWALADQAAPLTLQVRETEGTVCVDVRSPTRPTQSCEFPVARFLALHMGGRVQIDGADYLVSLQLPGFPVPPTPESARSAPPTR